ncbi:uncharacterized protein H6S33_002449 [Morchella sextelata]|uniref:uncharacterized protein n=1 Tax=Morchella sextelata TaxID=1174677 RepID=UPI001D04A380|nr:uncharacterized protein H6S33_002449 [Morchella sextelata]KAH0607415.1 hypothetical protein H6S33_002449 [Morchella sextelata]
MRWALNNIGGRIREGGGWDERPLRWDGDGDKSLSRDGYGRITKIWGRTAPKRNMAENERKRKKLKNVDMQRIMEERAEQRSVAGPFTKKLATGGELRDHAGRGTLQTVSDRQTDI